MLKRLVALFLFVLLSCESFASVISDSDGGAFVSKQEFEDLKAAFAKQIDDYNESIDRKIDGSIANYLAGINVYTPKWIDSNIDVFNYPLTIIDKLKVIEECTTSSTNKAEQTSLWRPAFTFFPVFWRSGSLVTEKFEAKQVDNINNFLNGTANTSAGTFKVINICKEPTLKWKNTFIHENCSAADGWDGGTPGQEYFANTFYLDADSEDGSADGKWFNRTTRNNYAKWWTTDKTNTDKFTLHWTIWHHASYGNDIYNRSDNIQARYDRYYSNGYNTKWCNGNGWFSSFYPDTNFDWDYEYKNVKLDRIYNYGNSSNSNHFAPVTYNNNVYFTNKKANRVAFSHASRIGWNTRSTDTLNRKYVKWMISAGENLEHEAEDTSRAWNKKSLISANRLIYDFETPDGELKTNHRMVNGIPIFFVSKSFRTTAIQKLQVQFTLTNSYASDNPKYVIFSKKPITTQVYSDNVEGNDDYVVIEKINNSTVGTKKGRISAGRNFIELKEDYLFDMGDTIYMKILWNDGYTSGSNYDESVIITKPQIAYIPESD